MELLHLPIDLYFLAECPSFSEIDHGTVTYIEAENATGARFSCDPDYGLVGSEFLECLPDGSWNGTAPECKRE